MVCHTDVSNIQRVTGSVCLHCDRITVAAFHYSNSIPDCESGQDPDIECCSIGAEVRIATRGMDDRYTEGRTAPPGLGNCIRKHYRWLLDTASNRCVAWLPVFQAGNTTPGMEKRNQSGELVLTHCLKYITLSYMTREKIDRQRFKFAMLVEPDFYSLCSLVTRSDRRLPQLYVVWTKRQIIRWKTCQRTLVMDACPFNRGSFTAIVLPYWHVVLTKDRLRLAC